MSTRATILIREKNEPDVHIYHHCDGYPEGVGSDLKHYLSSLKHYEWIANDIATALIKGSAVKDDNGYELTSCQHGDEEYAYLIDCDNKTLTCYSIGWDQFEWNEKDIVEIPD